VADASWAHGSGRDENWGPSTPVRAASADPHAARPGRAARPGAKSDAAGGWQSGPPRGQARPAAAPGRSRSSAAVARQRGLPAWGAVSLLVAVLVLGILIDTLRSEQLSTGFDLGIIVGSILAILAVRRSGMFWVVVSPPIVYSLGAGISLYLRSGGLRDRGVLIDAATNWLVYGFPAIAAATASVLIIAGFRLITRR
jgi:hypothetical protein